MNVIPWRISNFFNKYLHSLYMLVKYRTNNLNSEAYWNKRFTKSDYEDSHATVDVLNAIFGALEPGSSVCDVGVGTGFFLKKIRDEKQVDTFAIDISSVIIERLKTIGIDGVACELPNQPATDRKFDFVTALEVLEHLKYPGRSVETLCSLLKTNGKLIVTVPNDCLGPDVEPEHLRKYNTKTLQEELQDYVNIDSMDVIDNCLMATCSRK